MAKTKTTGQHCYTRPNRSATRHFDAGAVGRGVKCAREGGENCHAIYREVRERLLDSGCELEDCDCVRLRAVIQLSGEVAILAAAGLALWMSRGRAALAAIPELGAPTIEGEVISISYETYREAILASEMSLAEMEAALARIKYLGGELDAALLYSFSVKDEGAVTILDQIESEVENGTNATADQSGTGAP